MVQVSRWIVLVLVASLLLALAPSPSVAHRADGIQCRLGQLEINQRWNYALQYVRVTNNTRRPAFVEVRGNLRNRQGNVIDKSWDLLRIPAGGTRRATLVFIDYRHQNAQAHRARVGHCHSEQAP